VFVAIVSAIWSAPITIGANWLIMNILAAKTASSLRVEIANELKTQSIVVDRSRISNNTSRLFANRQVFVKSVGDEVHKLNEAVIQYKQSLSEAEQREYAGILLLMLLQLFLFMIIYILITCSGLGS
jgi:hypothetical protein